MDSDSERTSPSVTGSLDSDMTDYTSMSLMKASNNQLPVNIFKEEPDADRSFSPESLKFSIENILRPDFGCKIKQERFSPRPNFPSLMQPSVQKSSSCGHPGNIPAWIFCTRYSDRPSSGPRARRSKRRERKPEDKRPRTAFTQEQLDRLKREFQENRYLTEKRRQDLAKELQLNESQIKIWFQNKRAKLKKSTGLRNPLTLSLMAQGLYNHHAHQMQDGDSFCD